MSTLRRLATASAATSLLLTTALVGCGDDDEKTPGPSDTKEPVYSLATSVFSQAGSATYVSVFNSLDVTALDLTKAREHSGFATIGAVDGMLFVGAGEAPEVSRYTVKDDGTLEDAGRISFANYGLATSPLYFNQFVDSTSAYMSLEESRRILWNPSTMEISGPAEVPGVVREREDLVVKTGYDRARVVRGEYVFQSFYWTDGSYFNFLPTSQIAIYSKADDSLVKLLDAPCPGLDVATQDEAGNIYFSNWVFSSAAPVLKETAPATCMVRIKAGAQEIDTTFTRSLSSMVGGRQTAAFRYLGNGTGVVAVFHDENLTIDENTKATDITSGLHWKLWRVNLEAGTASPIEELGFIAGGYYSFTLDGRTFLLLPTADYSKTAIWELGVSGAPVKRFETLGWAYQFVKVR
ncbi:MxcI [Myxococcus llanfairpwllgwyngyllgogerychwyrndrobwllllantysiliogogogochensis]|uniref:MxcI n=1 Tax=Myxococcus llanfairpwllgwyngyllgogerychwyrndrobwllllantysiliogogogochensis TaxID=2590453 RepID=A0A540WQ90_9BACT|nr:MxcI [Myxococcus llanfairpwllgwyngyllgogerychwyrndrobwllllantysiliogogogochensis]TQF11178.1 MxcI [Myxococcus llanfairpwllgwyngyllgogerychwyrndrobwllllantysiliogogogochensis]